MTCATCVRPGVESRPLFFIHDTAWGQAFVHALADRMDRETPVYSMAVGAVVETPLATVEGMAVKLTRSMREIQPAGAYRLAGLSAAGMLAYEAALQLLGEDREVEFLGLVDNEGCEHSACASEGHEALMSATMRYCPQPITVPVHLFVRGTVPLAGTGRSWIECVPDDLLRVISIPRDAPLPSAAQDGRNLAIPMAHALRTGGVHGASGRHADARLVPLQSRSHRMTPCVCIPGAGADVTSFIDIVSSLGDSWPVYGLQPRGLEGELVPHSTVEAAARAYLQALDDGSLHGPLHLVGHSFGGWIAFEMAALLGEAGRRIATLTLLDSECPDADDGVRREYTDVDCLQEWIDALQQRLGRPLGIGIADLESRSDSDRREALHRQMVKTGMLPPQSSPGLLRGRLRTFAANLRTSYCPRLTYRGPATLVTAHDPELDADANQRRVNETVDGWRRWAPRLRWIPTPGNHMTMLSPPHVELVANVIGCGVADPSLAQDEEQIR